MSYPLDPPGDPVSFNYNRRHSLEPWVEWAETAENLARWMTAQGVQVSASTIRTKCRDLGIPLGRARMRDEEAPDSADVQAEAVAGFLRYLQVRDVPYLDASLARLSHKKLASGVVLSDLHMPFQHEGALNIVQTYLRQWRPDLLILNGDVLDLPIISSFPQNPAYLVPLQKTLDDVRSYLMQLRNATGPETEIVFVPGNHELDRLLNYLWRHASALASLRVLTLENMMGLAELGIAYAPEGVEVTDKLIVLHGDRYTNSLGGGSGMSARKEGMDHGISTVTGHCFSDDTEILTPTGWKRHADLSVGDSVLTLDATAERADAPLHWDTIQDMNQYHFDGELINIKGNGLDLLVTEEHGLLAPAEHNKRGLGMGRGSGRGVGWRRREARDFYGKEIRTFPLAGFHDGPGVPLSDAQIRVLAWVMAEGHFSDDTNACIRIAQSDYDQHLETLEADLDRANLTYSKTLRYVGGRKYHGQWRNYDAYRYGLKVAETGWVYEYLTREKTPTDSLRAMSLQQIEQFLDAYTTAGINKMAVNARQISSNRKDHIDFIQELAVRSGHRSTICERPGGMYCITINGRTVCRVTAKHGWAMVPYSGIVWCPTVGRGTVVVRRNGKTAIACNTHKGGIVYKRDRAGYRANAEGFSLCDAELMRKAGVMKTKKGGKVEDWHLGFTRIDFHPNGSAFNITPIPILEDGERTFSLFMGQEIEA